MATDSYRCRGRLRHLVSTLLAFVLSFALSHAEEGDRAPDRRRIQELFETLRRAVAGESPVAMVTLLDAGAAVEAVEALGVLEGLTRDERSAVSLGFRAGMPLAALRGDLVEPFESFEIRRVQWIGDDRAVVYVIHDFGDGLRGHARWYLTRSRDRWRIYDFVDLETNLRFSVIAAATVRRGVDRDASQWLAAIETLHEAVDLLGKMDVEKARGLLEDIAGVGWPAPLEAVRLLMLAACLLSAEEFAESLDASDRALDLHADLPLAHLLRASALNALARHEEALSSARRYGDVIEADAQAYLEVGDALAGLGRPTEAIEAWTAGLEDAPEDLDLLIQLMLYLPSTEKGRMLPWLKGRDDLAAAVDVLAEAAFVGEDDAALVLLATVLEARTPDHPDVQLYWGEVNYMRGHYGAAARRFLAGWQRATHAATKDLFEGRHLDAMLADGRPLDAFAESPDKREAFESVAYHLAGERDADGLRRLLDAAREEGVRTRHLAHLFAAEADWIEGRYREVVNGLAKRRAPILAEAEARDVEEAWLLLWDVEDRLIRSLVRLKRNDEALALARDVAARDEDLEYVVLVYLCRGDVARASAAVWAYVEAGGDGSRFLHDEDTADVLQTPPFAELRTKLAR